MKAPVPYEVLVASARTALRTQRITDAERDARAALALEPERGDAYNILAIVRMLQHELTAAKAFARAGLAVDPTCTLLQKNLARLGRMGAGPLLLGDEEDDRSPYRIARS
jgi:Flp pilus assembly protein TadD